MMNSFSGLGWRGKVGLILPNVNTVTEPVLYTLAPQGISFHTRRTIVSPSGPEAVPAMVEEKERAFRELAYAKPDCIVDCCTASGVLRGLTADKEFCSTAERETGIKTTSTIRAIIDTMEILKMQRFVIISPHTEAANERENTFFKEKGYDILNIGAMNLKRGYEYAQVSPQEIYRFCIDNWDNRADGLFITCINFNAMPVIQSLELALGVPVLSSLSATLWEILKVIGVNDPIWGHGLLLSKLDRGS
ncbi:hypothetical protein ACFLYL_03985 [Chloroflexota bacterium]